MPAQEHQEGSLAGGTHKGSPYVVMPDHFHGIVQVRRGGKMLGDVVGAFKMNPWKNIIYMGNGMRAIGNPGLLNSRKTGMLCSRNCPAEVLDAAVKHALVAGAQHCLLSGFHSLPERSVLAALL